METMGIDLYNFCLTNEVAKTLNAISCDADHVPCIIIRIENNEVDRNHKK